jgi:futalosine hydrolase
MTVAPEVSKVPRAPGVLLIGATELEVAVIRSSGFQVVVTGIGAVNTARALTSHLVSSPKPSLVIQTGVAGAFVPAEIPVGSVVLADTEIYGDMGVLTTAGWQPLEAIGIPLVPASDGLPARFNYFPLDPKLVARAAEIGGAHIARTGPFLTLSMVTGVRALGDELHERFGALCESMEGAAAAQICALYDVPFLEVRGISNLVEDRDREKWKLGEAAEAAQKVVLNLAERLP